MNAEGCRGGGGGRAVGPRRGGRVRGLSRGRAAPAVRTKPAAGSCEQSPRLAVRTKPAAEHHALYPPAHLPLGPPLRPLCGRRICDARALRGALSRKRARRGPRPPARCQPPRAASAAGPAGARPASRGAARGGSPASPAVSSARRVLARARARSARRPRHAAFPGTRACAQRAAAGATGAGGALPSARGAGGLGGRPGLRLLRGGGVAPDAGCTSMAEHSPDASHTVAPCSPSAGAPRALRVRETARSPCVRGDRGARPRASCAAGDVAEAGKRAPRRSVCRSRGRQPAHHHAPPAPPSATPPSASARSGRRLAAAGRHSPGARGGPRGPQRPRGGLRRRQGVCCRAGETAHEHGSGSE